jgi:hypothetical protein
MKAAVAETSLCAYLPMAERFVLMSSEIVFRSTLQAKKVAAVIAAIVVAGQKPRVSETDDGSGDLVVHTTAPLWTAVCVYVSRSGETSFCSEQNAPVLILK